MPWFQLPGCSSKKSKRLSEMNAPVSSPNLATSTQAWFSRSSLRRSLRPSKASLKKSQSVAISQSEIPESDTLSLQNVRFLNSNRNSSSITSLNADENEDNTYKSLWGKDLVEWESKCKLSQHCLDPNQNLEILHFDNEVPAQNETHRRYNSLESSEEDNFRLIDIKALLKYEEPEGKGQVDSCSTRIRDAGDSPEPILNVENVKLLAPSQNVHHLPSYRPSPPSAKERLPENDVLSCAESSKSCKTNITCFTPAISCASKISRPEGSSSLGSSNSSVSSQANSVSLDDSGTYCYSDDSENSGLNNSDNKLNAKNEDLLRSTLADIQREREAHAEEVTSIVNRHEQEVQDVNSKWESEINKLREAHVQETKDLQQNHHFEVDKVKILLSREISAKQDKVLQLESRLEGLVLELERERECHREEIQTLIQKHDREIQLLSERIETLKKSHDLHLQEITRNRQTQIEHIESVHRAKIDTMKKKHEEKLEQQMKQVPDNILRKEIESLEVVLQLKNQELKDLRRDLLEYKSKNDELIFLYEQNKLMHAKVEDLEAQIEKTRTDKNSILEKYNVMETSMHQMLNENDRLHLNNEQLSYKIEMMASDHSFALSETSEGDGQQSLPE